MAPFSSVSILGLGLIGSSIARAVRQNMPDVELVGYDASEDVQKRVRELGLVDRVATDPAILGGSALLVLAVPVGAYADVGEKFLRQLSAETIVSDVGSIKQQAIATLAPILPEGVAFVPAHPVAGTEQSGPDAGLAALFHDRWCILTPPAGTPEDAVARVARFWELLGSRVERMEPGHHDLVLAVTSHVPHLIAYSIVGTAADLEGVTESEIIKYSAGGFRDFTRIAASDPTMWRDVFLGNRDAVLEILGRFGEDLAALQRAIRWGDGEALYQRFKSSRAIRRQIIEAGQDTPAPDFGRARD